MQGWEHTAQIVELLSQVRAKFTLETLWNKEHSTLRLENGISSSAPLLGSGNESDEEEEVGKVEVVVPTRLHAGAATLSSASSKESDEEDEEEREEGEDEESEPVVIGSSTGTSNGSIVELLRKKKGKSKSRGSSQVFPIRTQSAVSPKRKTWSPHEIVGAINEQTDKTLAVQIIAIQQQEEANVIERRKMLQVHEIAIMHWEKTEEENKKNRKLKLKIAKKKLKKKNAEIQIARQQYELKLQKVEEQKEAMADAYEWEHMKTMMIIHLLVFSAVWVYSLWSILHAHWNSVVFGVQMPWPFAFVNYHMTLQDNIPLNGFLVFTGVPMFIFFKLGWWHAMLVEILLLFLFQLVVGPVLWNMLLHALSIQVFLALVPIIAIQYGIYFFRPIISNWLGSWRKSLMWGVHFLLIVTTFYVAGWTNMGSHRLFYYWNSLVRHF